MTDSAAEASAAERDGIAAKLAAASREGAAAVEAAQVHAEASPETTRSRTLVWQDPVPTAAAGATMRGMEYMEAIVAGEVPPPPIAVTMWFGPIEVAEGRAVFAGEPGETPAASSARPRSSTAAANRPPPKPTSPPPTAASCSPTA